MWNDLNKVDFNNVQEQSSWVCQCDESLITKLEQDFKQTLAQQVKDIFFSLLHRQLLFTLWYELTFTGSKQMISQVYSKGDMGG